MNKLMDATAKGYGTKVGKRGTLLYTEDGRPLDTLLEVKGKQGDDKQYVAVISKHCKPPIRVADAKGVQAARKFLAERAKAAATAKTPAAKKSTATKKPAVRKTAGITARKAAVEAEAKKATAAKQTGVKAFA